MAPVLAQFSFILNIQLPPIEFSCLKLRENFRSRKTQKVKGVKVTRKVKTVKQKFCIKKTHVYNNCYELRSRAIKNKIQGEKHFLNLFSPLQCALYLSRDTSQLSVIVFSIIITRKLSFLFC